MHFSDGNVSDLSPLAGLTNLDDLLIFSSPISDLSSLAGLTSLERITIGGAEISDLTPLAGLTHLELLKINGNKISNLSPLAGLTGLNHLNLKRNDISDISPIARLTDLKWLDLSDNNIFDLSPLEELRENIEIIWHNNPGFPKGGPKIEGPWLWVLVPDREIDSSTDLLSEASEGRVAEIGVSTHGATEGQAVNDDVWTAHRLPPSGGDNIGDMLKESIRDGVIYG
ncbi:MAG: hypothetical protein MJE68_25720, partial [Proteobacteria bacterium]|nr:hypothetical protein [Pseudomonadota bacterium]